MVFEEKGLVVEEYLMLYCGLVLDFGFEVKHVQVGVFLELQ